MVCFHKCPKENKKKKNYVDRLSALNIAQPAEGQAGSCPSAASDQENYLHALIFQLL